MPNTSHFRFPLRLLLTIALGGVAYYAAYWLRFDGQFDDATRGRIAESLGWILAIKAAAALHGRLHQDFARYVTFHDMLRLARSVTFGTIGIMLVDSMLLTDILIPRSVIMLDWGANILLLAGVRIAVRLWYDGNWRQLLSGGGTSVLIVGANDAGEALLRSLRTNSQLPYDPIGFVDERTELRGRRIAGIPVLGRQADIPELVRHHGIEEVLITSGTLSGRTVRELVDLSNEHDFRVKVLPSYEQLVNEQVDVAPRSVAITDLLRRPSVQLDHAAIRHWLAGKRILVTGSAGSIGSEICRQLLELEPAELILVDRSETGQFFLERELRSLAPEISLQVALADLNDQSRLRVVFEQFAPEIVFHAAAYKHVPLMEAHCGEAVKNIVLASRNVVDLAEEFGCESFVMISTDKAVNPTSVMGSCKRLAEQYVEAKAGTSPCRLVTVRFGNVLDSAGSVVPIFRQQIAEGGPVTITHPEMIRYFMLIPEAAQLVIQAGAMGQGGEIFVLDMGEPVRILDLASDMIRLSGLRVGEDIEIVTTGLRPGEKLYEELYSDLEQHRPTQHEKIMTAVGQPRSLLRVLQDVNSLAEMVDAPNEEVRAALAAIIPVQSTPAAPPDVAAALRVRRAA